MGKQYTNKLKFPATMEVRSAEPIDDRMVVSDVDSLTTLSTWLGTDGGVYYHYKGMTVTVADTGTIYVYIGESGSTTDVIDKTKWIKATGSSASGDYVEKVTSLPTITTDSVEGTIVNLLTDGKLYVLTKGDKTYDEIVDLTTTGNIWTEIESGIVSDGYHRAYVNGDYGYIDEDYSHYYFVKHSTYTAGAKTYYGYDKTSDIFIRARLNGTNLTIYSAVNYSTQGFLVAGSTSKYSYTTIDSDTITITYNSINFTLSLANDFTIVAPLNLKLKEDKTAELVWKELLDTNDYDISSVVSTCTSPCYPLYTLNVGDKYKDYTTNTGYHHYEQLDSSTSSEESTFDAGSITSYQAHGLDLNTDVSGKTALEVLKMILFATFAPVWKDTSTSLSITPNYLEVGTSIPLKNSFKVTADKASATTGSTTVYGGDATIDNIYPTNSSLSLGTLVNTMDIIEIAAQVTYASNTSETVKDSDGNATNKTATKANTKISDSSVTVNSNISTDGYIQSITDYPTTKIYFVYPIYVGTGTDTTASYYTQYLRYFGGTGTITTGEGSILNSGSTNETLLIKSGEYLYIDIPTDYTNVKIEYYDNIAGKWFTITDGSGYTTFSSTTYDYTFGTGTKNYTEYRFGGGATEAYGERKYRITYTEN